MTILSRKKTSSLIVDLVSPSKTDTGVSGLEITCYIFTEAWNLDWAKGYWIKCKTIIVPTAGQHSLSQEARHSLASWCTEMYQAISFHLSFQRACQIEWLSPLDHAKEPLSHISTGELQSSCTCVVDSYNKRLLWMNITQRLSKTGSALSNGILNWGDYW